MANVILCEWASYGQSNLISVLNLPKLKRMACLCLSSLKFVSSNNLIQDLHSGSLAFRAMAGALKLGFPASGRNIDHDDGMYCSIIMETR